MLRAHIKLIEEDDELVWIFSSHVSYTHKEGYVLLTVVMFTVEWKWWWKVVWKAKCVKNVCVFIWFLKEDKVPTWNNIQKHHKEGLEWFALCYKDS